MFHTLLTLLYYQIDNVFNSNIYFKFKEEIHYFNPIFNSIYLFILFIFVLLSINLIVTYKIKNSTIYSLLFIYIKYNIDNIIYNNNIGILQYEIRRSIMYLFTKPLMLNIYCDLNNMKITKIYNYPYMFANFFITMLHPFRNIYYNKLIISLLSLSELYFINNLFSYKHKNFTIFIINIWILYIFLGIIDLFNILNINDIQIFNLIMDSFSKFFIIIIIIDNYEHIKHINSSIDLQSISLLTNIKKTINTFKTKNNLTNKSNLLIDIMNNSMLNFYPDDNTTLKMELLKKILPFEFEDKYLSKTIDYKKYDFIAVLFADIVSYTEIAKEYDAHIVYSLLDDIYSRFDNIIISYNNLQKIETIGDSYMVVSDIYTNDQKDNIKNIILFALDIFKEIKKINTPNNKPLQLRVGINLGKVVVGILGLEIPRLCVIGNTVNIASRLQSNADSDTIQISTHVKEIAAELNFGFDLSFEKRENVLFKNIGFKTTYTIHPELCKNMM